MYLGSTYPSAHQRRLIASGTSTWLWRPRVPQSLTPSPAPAPLPPAIPGVPALLLPLKLTVGDSSCVIES